jgi:hypothetical protein
MEDIKKEIVEYLDGIEPPRVCGFLVAIKVFVQDKQGDLILTESKTEKWTSIVGRVVSLGAECFPEDRFPSGPRCKAGDWVVFRPNSSQGQRLMYRGHLMEWLPDDHISCTLEDPTYVTRC